MNAMKIPDHKLNGRMDRRAFLCGASAAALAWSLPVLKRLVPTERMGVVVHSYGKRFGPDNESTRYPAFRDAMDMISHCHAIGAGGVQVGLRGWTDDFAGRVRELRERLGMYLEGSVMLPGKDEDSAEFERQVKQAKAAGAGVVRTVCLGGRRYETFETLAEFNAFRAAALRSLERAEPIVRRNRIKLAVENHKDWRVPELTAIMDRLSSEWIGVTIDFGNSIALLEDPLATVRGLAPYIFSTHVKDMGLKEYEDGFLLSEVPLGDGICDLPQMIDICRTHNPEVRFNLEMITRDPLKVPCLSERYWATFDDLPAPALARTLRTVKTRSFPGELPVLSHLNGEEQLAAEENNVVKCLRYSAERLGLG